MCTTEWALQSEKWQGRRGIGTLADGKAKSLKLLTWDRDRKQPVLSKCHELSSNGYIQSQSPAGGTDRKNVKPQAVPEPASLQLAAMI